MKSAAHLLLVAALCVAAGQEDAARPADANKDSLLEVVPSSSSFKFDNREFKSAVGAWCAGGAARKKAEAAYGTIDKWDVSEVTDISKLIKDQASCNPFEDQDVSARREGATRRNHYKGHNGMDTVVAIAILFTFYVLLPVFIIYTSSAAIYGQAQEMAPDKTVWESIKCGYYETFTDKECELQVVNPQGQGVSAWEASLQLGYLSVGRIDHPFWWDYKYDVPADGRRSEQVPTGLTMTFNPLNRTQAWHVIQVMSTVSGSQITSIAVSKLQAVNYTGPMPSMVTSELLSITDAGGGSSGDSSGMSATIVAAIVVAAVLLLIAALVVGALVYMYKRNKNQAPAAQAGAVPAQMMGSVGVSMNPMHANAVEERTPTAHIA